MKFSLKNRIIWVVGHNGMVGQAILRKLGKDHDIISISRKKLDSSSQNKVERWIKAHNPEVIFLTAGKVRGIYANKNYPADFIYQNIIIAANVINGAYKNKEKKLI